jgi:aminoglycoside 3-N-acetyltransferase
MSEADTVNKTPMPHSRASLATDLRQLGLEAGMTVIVHSALSALGWVIGGPVAVVQALTDVITPDGTIVMPTHTTEYSDPEPWQHPPVPQEWWQMIRDHMPAFDPQITPTRGMGAIVEVFRTLPGTLRSNHPTLSFAAWGRHADQITSSHALEFSLGETSPLARVYDLNGKVLLLGVGYENCTSLHLAQYRTPGVPEEMQGSPYLENGQRVWKVYRDIDLDTDHFADIGLDFEGQHDVKVGKIGLAQVKLFSQRAAVDFAQRWLTNRTHQPKL